jgi:hypothetical protein
VAFRLPRAKRSRRLPRVLGAKVYLLGLTIQVASCGGREADYISSGQTLENEKVLLTKYCIFSKVQS